MVFGYWRLAGTMMLLFAGAAVWPESSAAADGDLDTSFGINGLVETNVPDTAQSFVMDAVVLDDGRILLLATTGESFFSEDRVVLAAYHADGELDTSFGNGGFLQPDLSFFDVSARTLSKTTGEMVYVSAFGREAQSDSEEKGVVFRVSMAGALDPSFGTNGLQITSPGSVTAHPDGGFVVVGAFEPDSNSQIDVDIEVWKHDANGMVDSAFGSNGRAIVRFNEYRDIPFDTVVQDNGKIFIVGLAGRDRGFTGSALRGDFGLARLLAGGGADPSFGLNGQVITPTLFESYATRVSITENNNLVVAGQSQTESVGAPSVATPTIVYYRSDGSPDPAYGDQGVVYLETGAGLQGRNTHDFWSQPDGKFVLAFDEVGESNRGPGMVRLLGDGTPDSDFGDLGYALFGPQFLYFSRVQIVVADSRTIGAGLFRNSLSEFNRIGLAALTGGIAELVFSSGFE